MRKLGLAVFAAASMIATGAFAQVGIGVGPGGVSVGVGEPGYHRGHHHHDRYYHDHGRRDWRGSRAEERVIIKERRERPRRVVKEYYVD